MDFRKVELEDDAPILGALGNADMLTYGPMQTDVHIPVYIEDSKGEMRCLVPLAEDEPIFISTERFSEGLSTITVIGKLCATPLKIDSLTNTDTARRDEKRFDKWVGDWGGFLKTTVTVTRVNDRFEYSGDAEFAIMETQEEFDTHGQTSGKEVFESRQPQPLQDPFFNRH